MGQLTEADKKRMNKLHFFFLLYLLGLCAIMYYLTQLGNELQYSYSSFFFIISSVFMLISILIASKIYSININNALKLEFPDYQQAMMNFRAANMIKWFVLIGATSFNSVFAFLDQNPLIIVVALVGVLYLYASKVKPEHFKNYKYLA